jgi:hypothetical protein
MPTGWARQEGGDRTKFFDSVSVTEDGLQQLMLCLRASRYVRVTSHRSPEGLGALAGYLFSEAVWTHRGCSK